MILFLNEILGLLEEYGAVGLFIISFLEAFIFPIPPEFIFIPLCLADTNNIFGFVMITTLGSVIGSLPGYIIGLYGGRPLLNKFFNSANVNYLEDLMSKYGSMAILIAGFSPIPFKLITIASGALRKNMNKLILYSAISRGARFSLEGILITYMGKTAMDFITGRSFLYLTIGLSLLGLIIYISYIYYKLRIKK
ncbi:MAG: DedA family protein [Firmicutes bacterium]|nr:DedA family protein [Bacillota bacterium]